DLATLTWRLWLYLRRSDSDHTGHSNFTPVSYVPQPTSAMPIVAASVSLPAQAGTADLLSLLPPTLRAAYSSPQLLLRQEAGGSTPPAARARVFGTRAEYVALVRRMRAVGMVTFTVTPKVVNGVFAVPKDEGKALRLIIDAR